VEVYQNIALVFITFEGFAIRNNQYMHERV